MLLLFMLNVLGFYGIFLGLQFKYTQDANRNLDEERYSGGDEMTFKIPVAVPYYADNQDYERVTGEFEHDGDVYRLLKQKYSGDTLYIVCVKDVEAKKISQALTDYVKTFSDKPVNAKQQSTKSIQSFCKDYITTGISVESQASGWKEPVVYGHSMKNYLSLASTRIKYPPKHFLSV
jgi:hypothetical protein